MPAMRWTAEFAQDSRYALRWFRREAVLTGSVLLTLAFGVGVNTGVFSILSGMVFRPRIEHDPATFFQALTTRAGRTGAPQLFASSIDDFESFSRARTVRSIAAWTVVSARIADDPGVTLLQLASCGFFPLYGLERPLAGRLFEDPECDSPDAPPVALISEQVWAARFQRSPRILGQPLEIGGRRYTVVGILPAEFAGRLRGPGIWIPHTQQRPFYGGADLFAQRSTPWLTVEGRIAPGFSRAQAVRELRALTPGRELVLTNGSIFEDPSARVAAGAVSILLTGALALVLLLACANVTSLLLARAVSRRYEISVRLSMGASPARLLRMAATEGALLAVFSAGASLALATALPAAFTRLVPQMPHYPVHTDWVVFAYLASITLLAGCAASLVPAAESLRENLGGSLKREEAKTRRGIRLRQVLVALQAGLSLTLMIAAALIARTEHRLVTFQPGFNAAGVLMAPVSGADRTSPWTLASSLFWSRGEQTLVTPHGGRAAQVQVTAVTARFFETLAIPVRGQTVDPARPNDVVLTEASARALLPGSDAIGRTLTAEDGTQWRVVGIVRASDLDERSPVPRVFRPMPASQSRAVALLRFSGDADAASRNFTAAAEASGLTLRELPRTIAADMGALGNRFSVIAGFATFFGVSSFALALVGLYGVIAFLAGRRTKEMGVRLALGATRADLVREVIRSGLKPVAWGMAAALPLAAALAAGMAFAFRNTPAPFHAADPLVFAATPLLLLTGAVAAMLRPALRAANADPAAALRQD